MDGINAHEQLVLEGKFILVTDLEVNHAQSLDCKD